MKHLGILTALLPEASCLTPAPVINKPIQLAENITLFVSGMGLERVNHGTEQLILCGADALLCLGTAGALTNSLKPGSLILPEKIISTTNTLQVDTHWHEHAKYFFQQNQQPFYTEPLLSSTDIIDSTNDKQQLHDTTGAIAVDMESASILKIAADNAIPALVIRTIVDPVDLNIPTFVMKNTDHYGNTDLSGLLLDLLAHPGQLLNMIRLATSFRAASHKLTWLGRHLVNLNLPT